LITHAEKAGSSKELKRLFRFSFASSWAFDVDVIN